MERCFIFCEFGLGKILSQRGGLYCSIFHKIELKRTPSQDFIGWDSDRAVILEEREGPVIYGLNEKQIKK